MHIMLKLALLFEAWGVWPSLNNDLRYSNQVDVHLSQWDDGMLF